MSRISVIMVALILMSTSLTTSAKVTCSDVAYGQDNYSDKMDQLAKTAKLPNDYWDRYHEAAVSALCGSGSSREIDELVNAGYLKPREVEAIAKALGKTYQAPKRSKQGKLYEQTYKKLMGVGLCSACASNIAEEYVKNPNGAFGKVINSAMSGNQSAIDKIGSASNPEEAAKIRAQIEK